MCRVSWQKATANVRAGRGGVVVPLRLFRWKATERAPTCIFYDTSFGEGGGVADLVLDSREPKLEVGEHFVSMIALRRMGLIQYQDKPNELGDPTLREVRVLPLAFRFRRWVMEPPFHEHE